MSKKDTAHQLIQSAHSIAVLTGAGVSAESGIPTFRGAGGYWRNLRFEDLATPQGFARNPKLVWEWYEERRRGIAEAKPNAGHYALRDLERTKPIFSLITQNVDGLHDLAGSTNIIKLHGDLWTVRCLNCGTERVDRSRLTPLPPHCACGGMLRPGVVRFGEELPPGAMERAADAVRVAADVADSSRNLRAEVYPAVRSYPDGQSRNRGKPGKPPRSPIASLRSPCAEPQPEILPPLLSRLSEKNSSRLSKHSFRSPALRVFNRDLPSLNTALEDNPSRTRLSLSCRGKIR